MDAPPALVTDADLSNAVWGIRGLGRAGISVDALAPRRSAAGLWSRYVHARGTAPDAAVAPARLLESVAAKAATDGPLVAYLVREEALAAAIYGWADGVPEGVLLPFGGLGSIARLRDKRQLGALAATAGLRAPEVLVEGPAAHVRQTRPALPCVVKPALPAGRLPTARVVSSAVEWEQVVGDLPPAEPLVVQELVSGPLVSLGLVLDRDGTVVAAFQEEAHRTWPVAAGSIALSHSVAPDGELVERVAAMLQAAGHWGLAHLDLMAAPGGHCLIDVNPRFYSCLPLALACGVNLPAAWHRAAIGQPPSPVGRYPTGVRYRWLAGDLYAARRGAWQRLRPVGAGAGATWAADDPAPSALLSAEPVVRAVGGRLPGRRHG